MEYTLKNETLNITLPERLDTAIATQVEGEISQICQANEHQGVELDAKQLTYISSTGLRIVLALVKREKQCIVVNASPDVYNVFEMTGFLRLIKVERALREVNIDGCTEIGRGGVGTVYRLTDETIIKVFREGTDLTEVKQEIQLSRDAFLMGMPTAISFETVRVGNQYGLIHELIDAKTLAQQINADPEHAEDYGTKLGLLMRHNHDIEVTGNSLPDAVAETEDKLEKLHRYFSDEEVKVLTDIYRAIPKGNRLLHCDLHPKNVMVSNGELLLIDMGEVCCGHPMQDLSHTYSSMKGLVGSYEGIIGMTEELASRVFDSAMHSYFGTDDEALLAHRMEQIQVASLVRNFTWLALSDSFPDELIQLCRKTMTERVMNQLPRIREVIKTFGEWEQA